MPIMHSIFIVNDLKELVFFNTKIKYFYFQHYQMSIFYYLQQLQIGFYFSVKEPQYLFSCLPIDCSILLFHYSLLQISFQSSLFVLRDLKLLLVLQVHILLLFVKVMHFQPVILKFHAQGYSFHFIVSMGNLLQYSREDLYIFYLIIIFDFVS